MHGISMEKEGAIDSLGSSEGNNSTNIVMNNTLCDAPPWVNQFEIYGGCVLEGLLLLYLVLVLVRTALPIKNTICNS